MKFLRLVAVGVVILCAACGATAEQTRIRERLRLIQLSNGAKVFVYPRPEAPLFSGVIAVDAGSVDEEAGQTGLAHLLEHMAFKGTPWIGARDWEKEKPLLEEIERVGSELTGQRAKTPPDLEKIESLSRELAALQKKASQYTVSNEYDQIIAREGGQEVNASTDNDYTNYYMTLPSNKLELWAMMESQRMLYPAWREFYLERDVVAEERRMRTEDAPIGRLYEEFIAASFKAHPYRNPVIGWMSDILSLTVGKIDRFYREWYVPENMVIILAGDLNLDEVRSVMEKYFGTMPARRPPPRLPTIEPPQKGEKRVQVVFDAEPHALVGWHKPTLPDRDMYVFEVIQYLLSRTGRASRLYERLIKRDSLAAEAEAFTGPGDKYPNLFILSLIPRAPHTLAEVEAAAFDEIERIKHEPVSDEELAKIRNQIDASFLKELETNLGFGKRLAYYYIASRDPDILDKMRDEMKSVTAQDIMRVAQKYLTAENRTVAELITRHETPNLPRQGVEVESQATSAVEAMRKDSGTTAAAVQPEHVNLPGAAR